MDAHTTGGSSHHTHVCDVILLLILHIIVSDLCALIMAMF